MWSRKPSTRAWNERWTFAGRAATYSLPRRLVSFHGAYAGSLALSLTVVGVGVAVWGQHVYLLANAAALPLNFLWTYAVSNWVIWRRGAEPAPPDHSQDPCAIVRARRG